MQHIVNVINDEINNRRKVIYFITSDIFKTLYKSASEAMRIRVEIHIMNRDVAGVKEWIDNQRALDLSTMTLIDLRQAARGLGVLKVERFNKNQLISLIVDRRRQNENNRRSAASGPENGSTGEGAKSTGV